MPILYSIDGEPRVIPDSLVDNFLAKGYRRTPLGVKATVSDVVSTPEVADPSLIPINTASLKDLIELPQVGTSIAKKVIANRPYASIEDLVEKVKIENLDWVALQAQISF